MSFDNGFHRRDTLALLGALLAGAGLPASARTSVRLVVPAAGGGNVDTPARNFADYYAKKAGIPMIIDNKPGASGVLAASIVAKAPPDGQSWLLTTSQHATFKHFYKGLPFDPEGDLVPVATLSTAEFGLIVPGNSKIKDIEDWKAKLLEKPEGLTYVSAGTGSAGHLGVALLEQEIGGKALHIPLKSGPEIIQYLLGGEADFSFQPLVASLPFLAKGQLRLLAVSGRSRAAKHPKSPTLAETIAPGYEFETWMMFMAPKGTPRALQEQLNAIVRQYLADPATKEFFERFSSVPRPLSLERTQAYFAAEAQRLGAVASKMGVLSGG